MKRFAIAAACALLCPGLAQAHGIIPGVSGFYAGALGLLASPTGALGVLVIATFAAIHPARRAGWTAECFSLGILAGFAFAAIARAAPPAALDLAPLIAAGGLLAAGLRLPAAGLFALAAIAGAAQGWHDGADTQGRPDALTIAAGMTLTAYVAVASAISLTAWFLGPRAAWRMIALRAGGSWITAIALMVGGFALAHP